MKNNITDQEVYDIAVKIAKKEFHQNPNIYRCEVLDLAGDMFKLYQHYTKPHIDKAEDPKGFAVKGLYFALSSIRKLAFNESKRIVIESEILDGRFEGNNYFELLEGAGKLNLWDDNEKVIDTSAEKTRTFDRDCFYDKIDNPVCETGTREFWDKLESSLSKRDYQITVMVFIEGKTVREIADKVGISKSAVDKVIKNLAKLSKQFEDFR